MFKDFIQNSVIAAWRSSTCPTDELHGYAEEKLLHQTRHGVTLMCMVFAVLMLAEVFLYLAVFNEVERLYTCVMLAALGAHIGFTCRNVDDQKTLHLLGMTLLIIGGTAFLLSAQNTGGFSTTLFVSIALLFMLIPIVPWGLREGVTIAALIYLTFTLSTWSRQAFFDRENLWVLQFLMLGTMGIALLIVARNTLISKADIRARYALENANSKINELSNKDPLTGAWNRRYYQGAFITQLYEHCIAPKHCFFGFFDLDNFKQLNDLRGHAYGDHVLIELVQAFSQHSGNEDVIIRMGGDEFAVCFTSDDAQAFLQHVHDTWVKNCQRIHTDLAPSFSAGVVPLDPGYIDNLEQLYQTADSALYRAKARKQQQAETLKVCLVS